MSAGSGQWARWRGPAALAAALVIGAVGATSAQALEHPFLEELGAVEKPELEIAGGMAVRQSSGEVLAIDRFTRAISRYNPDGTPAEFAALGSNVLDGKPGPGGKGCAEEEASCDDTPSHRFDFGSVVSEGQVAVDDSGGVNDGNIYVTHVSGPGEVYAFDEDGRYLGSITGYEEGGEEKSLGSRVCGVAVDSAGDLYVGDRSFGVRKYSPAASPPVNADSSANFPFGSTCTIAPGEGASAGFLFVAKNRREVIKMDSSTGAIEYTVDPGPGTTVSVDPVDGHAYVAGEGAVREYDASGAAPVLKHTIALDSDPLGVAVDESGRNVYISREGGARIEVYGPVVPTAPTIFRQWVESATTSEARVAAEISPNGLATTYHLEYGTTTAYGQSTEEREVGSDSTRHAVGELLDRLAPGTTYHWRMVATNPVGTKEGADRVLRTHSKPGADPCPNALFRTGPAALLPDCRAYEMVSPVDKGGADIFTFETAQDREAAYYRSSATGEGLTYSSYQAFGDAQSKPYTSQYVARRSTGGWESHGVSPPRGTSITPNLDQNDTEFKAFSNDLCDAWLARDESLAAPLAVEELARTSNLYRRSDCGSSQYEWLGAGRSGSRPVELQGVLANGGTAIFRGQMHLAQDAASELGQTLKCETPSAAQSIAYRWLANGAPIDGANGSSYVPSAASTTTPPTGVGDEGKAIQCEVRLVNPGSGAAQMANPAWLIAPYPAEDPPRAPRMIAAPGADAPLTVGGPGGQTLSCDPGEAEWGGAPAFGYRWYRNGAPIAGAEGQIYEVQGADLVAPAAFQCEAIGQNAAATVAMLSESTFSDPAPADPPAPRARTRGTGFDEFLYVARGGELHSVCVEPGGTQSSGCTAGTAYRASADTREGSVSGALAEDGQTVFWSDEPGRQGRIYARVNPTRSQSGLAHGWARGEGGVSEGSTEVSGVSSSAGAFEAGQEIFGGGIAPGTTIAAVGAGTLTLSAPASGSMPTATLVATSECTEPAKACTEVVSGVPAQFWAAAADGSRAIFSVGSIFSDAVSSTELYEYDRASAERRLIASEVAGVIGASADARRIYLVSSAALDAEENDWGERAQAGSPNLYFHEAGAGFRFIARLSRDDAEARNGQNQEFTPLNLEPFKHLARVSADGLHAVLMSRRALTGRDNTDAENGEADAEVFRYAAGGDRLECVSCNPSGARPVGRNLGNEPRPYWAASRVRVPENQLYQARYLSADGSRVFFDSFAPLVPRDTNGRADVYQWEEPGAGTCKTSSHSYSPLNGGCLDLLSAGDSPVDSEFLDADPGGENAFFRTGSSLTGADPGSIDVYDARAGGGIAEAAIAPPCEGDACQSPPAPPKLPSLSSSAFSGPGNVSSGGSCRPAAKRATRLARRAKRLRRAAARAKAPAAARRMRRRARRLTRRARAQSRAAKRCRRANRAKGRAGR